jgi:hypothetical protein
MVYIQTRKLTLQDPHCETPIIHSVIFLLIQLSLNSLISFFFFFLGGVGGFRLLLSSVALSCFNQSLRGLVSIQHVLLSRFPWTRYQNQLKLPIPIEDQWIPPETSWIPLEETIEAHKQWVPLVSLVTGVDEPGTTW